MEREREKEAGIERGDHGEGDKEEKKKRTLREERRRREEEKGKKTTLNV